MTKVIGELALAIISALGLFFLGWYKKKQDTKIEKLEDVTKTLERINETKSNTDVAASTHRLSKSGRLRD